MVFRFAYRVVHRVYKDIDTTLLEYDHIVVYIHTWVIVIGAIYAGDAMVTGPPSTLTRTVSPADAQVDRGSSSSLVMQRVLVKRMRVLAPVRRVYLEWV